MLTDLKILVQAHSAVNLQYIYRCHNTSNT